MACKSARPTTTDKRICIPFRPGRAKTAVSRKSEDINKNFTRMREAAVTLKDNERRMFEPHSIDLVEPTVAVGPVSCEEVVPKRKYRLYPVLIGKGELERLKEISKHVTLEEKVAELEKSKKQLEEKAQESQKRKQFLKDIDDAKLKARLEYEKKLIAASSEEIDEDSKRKVLERAFLAKQEQEDEVKRANQIILAAKCHIIREAQIAEKQELEKEARQEEVKKDRQMLEEAAKSIQKDGSCLVEATQKKAEFAKEIKAQLEEREYLRLLEAENIHKEAQKRLLAEQEMRKENEENIRLKHERQQKFLGDLKQLKEVNKLFKRMHFEQEKAAEMQVQAYLKEKEERERKLALQKRLEKEAFQRNQEKIVIIHEKLSSSKEKQLELNLKRAQEEKEREYRAKEKEAALKKKKYIEDIIKTREIQLQKTKERQAFQITQDETDFKESIELLKAELAKEKALKEERAKQKMKYRQDIVNQMNQRELERREQQQQAKKDFLDWQERERIRNRNIRAVIESKLDQMRQANMPEKYIKDVAKQVKQTLTSKMKS